MDYLTLSLVLSFISIITYAIFISGRRDSRLPPGPSPFPIIGNLLHLGEQPHISLATLAKRYGPLMSLKLGSKTAIVVSSPDVAKEFFQKHDHLFSSRSIPEAGRVVDHDKYSMVWLPVGDQWRRLRRISKEYLFSLQRLDATETLRQKKVKELLDHVSHCCTSEKDVNIGGVAFTTLLNMLSYFMFSMDLAQYDSLSSQEFKDDVWSIMEVVGKPNISDFFSIFKSFDPQGLMRHGTMYANKILNIFDTIIDHRLQTRSTSSTNNNDVLELLLNLNQSQESEWSRTDIRNMKPQDMDMREKFGLTLQKSVPLKKSNRDCAYMKEASTVAAGGATGDIRQVRRTEVKEAATVAASGTTEMVVYDGCEERR
ncbi:hypothetical protein E3N88_37066 [Mikania micrantha]|uniref:Cytochrome P450 n=1 Tax=Mikania micrantha TaxID=192012 RepID=A0A5N6M6K7_9ASTR|nr:hypothetical protein E3N88_37066 [Mikania micrantha]